jgi:hypothetical protein
VGEGRVDGLYVEGQPTAGFLLLKSLVISGIFCIFAI